MWRLCSVCGADVDASESRAVAAVCDVAACLGKKLLAPAPLVRGACAGCPTAALADSLKQLRDWSAALRARGKSKARPAAVHQCDAFDE